MSEFHECVVGTFDKELQALIDYGHDCCARIDDRIYECCQRIREAHEQELDNMSGAYEISMAWMKEQLSPVTYDVLGNERHKAVCELRKSDFTLYTPEQFVETLYKMLYMTGGAPTNIFVMQKAVRDRLIYLLSGDTAEVEDGMDAGRCDETNAAVGVPAADKRRADCDDNQPSEEVASITQELREWFKDRFFMANGWQEIRDIADRIDAEHERKVAEVASGWDYWESTHVELPKDEDGEYIHIGDVMDSKVDYLFDGKPFTVRGLVLCEDGWEAADGRFGNRYGPDSLRHHHEPTVEDVLRGVVTLCHNTWKKGSAFEFYDVDDVMKSGNIAEYAAKLRLASDANA